jgi:glutamyl-tRNA synthetase
VDDIEMKISHAVRGEEWLPSAPAHILIYRYLGLENEMPKLAHLPLILKPDGNGKLSKRDKSGLPMFPLNWFDERTGESYIGYREHGFFSEAFINMLALLGWNPGNNLEILSKEQLISLFSFERVNKAGAKFDPEKTKWFNQQYLRQKSNEELAELFSPILKDKNIQVSQEFVVKACSLLKEKAHFIAEFWDQGYFLFQFPESLDKEVIAKKLNTNTLAFVKKAKENLASTQEFTAIETEKVFKSTAEEMAIAPGQVMQLFRVCISGVGGGPALFEMMELLGKQECLRRIDLALSVFEKSLN